MSSKAADKMNREQRRQQEREERRRKREQARESTSMKTPAKDEKRIEKVGNGNAKTTSSKRAGVPAYNKVNIIEKTAKFDRTAPENGLKSKSESRVSKVVISSRKSGSNFKDHLSKFESQTKPAEKEKKAPFVRSQNGSASQAKKGELTSAKEPEFRRSYRTNRQTAAVDDARHRRSLKTEKIADRIARLQRQNSSEEGSSNKNATSPRSKGSSASTSQTSMSDSKAATTKTLSRAQQALERHKNRMRSSSQSEKSSSRKPSSPITNTSGKPESKSKQSSEANSEAVKGEKTRRISVSATPTEGDAVEVTTVTEVVSLTDEKMNIVIKEVAVDEEDAEKLLSPAEGKEYEPGDPRPISVEQAVAVFSKQEDSPTDEPTTEAQSHPTTPPTESSSQPKTMNIDHVTHEQDVIVIETTSDVNESTDRGAPSLNSNQNSNQGTRDVITDEVADIAKDVAAEIVGIDCVERSDTESPEQTRQSISPEEAIDILKRLSDEVQSGKEDDTEETKVDADDSEDLYTVAEANGRPTTLHIEEALYVTEDPPSPPPSEANPLTKNSFATALAVFSHASAPSSGTSSPVKSWGKYSTELSSISSGSLSPTKSQGLLSSSETPSSGGSSPTKVRKTISLSSALSSGHTSPTKSQKFETDLSNFQSSESCSADILNVTATEVSQISESLASSPLKSPPNSPASPTNSPVPPEYFVDAPKRTESPVKSPVPSVQTPDTPQSLPKSPESPTKSLASPTKTPETSSETANSPPKSPASPTKFLASPTKTSSETELSPPKSPASPTKFPINTPSETAISPPASPTKFLPSPIRISDPVTETLTSPKSPVKSPASPVQTPASPVAYPVSIVASPAKNESQSISVDGSFASSPEKSVSQIKGIFEANKAGSEFQHPELKSPITSPDSIQSPGISHAKSSYIENQAVEVTSENISQEDTESSKNLHLNSAQSTPESTAPPADRSNSTVNSEPVQKSSPPSHLAESTHKIPAETENISAIVEKDADPLPIASTVPVQKQKNVAKPVSKMIATRSVPRYKKSWLDESDDDNISMLSDAASDASAIDMDWLGPDSDDEHAFKKQSKLRASSAAVERSSSSAQDMLKIWEKKVHEPEEVKKNAPEKMLGESLKRVGSVRETWMKNSGPTHNGHSTEGSPRKSPKREKSARNSPIREASLQSVSSRESQEEMADRQEIFEDLKASGKIGGAKAMFESLSQSPQKSPLRSPRKRAEPRDDQGEGKEYSSVSQESSSSQISDSQDESPIVDNMRAMFERQNNKKSDGKKKKTSEKKDNPTSKRLSNVQRRAAGRRQEKRSMTQPVTSDDVIKAQDIMKDSLKASSDTEEEELNFVDRLKFFNQLAKSSPHKSRVRRRSDTQPVKSSQITEAARQFEEKRNQADVTESSKDRPPPISLADISPSKPPIISPTIAKLTRKFSTSESEDGDSIVTSSSTADDTEPGRKKLLLSSSEESNDMSARVAEIKTTGSIHDRMKRLQKNQTEERWKKSSKNSEVKSSVNERLNLLKGQEERWKKSNNQEFASRVEKLSDRIAKMKEDSETWKGRTGKQNDATQFTVQAKLAKRDGKKLVAVLPSPVVKRRALPEGIPSQKQVSEKDVKKLHESSSMNQLSFVEKLSRKGLEENVIKTTEVHTTEVPTIDHEEFDKFFGNSALVDPTIANGFHEDIENLPVQETVPRLSDLGRLKSSVKLQTKRRSSKRNPLKVLAARTDLKLSYDSERSNVGKLEQQRIAVQRGHGANFTSAALAGLAAKADLKKVNLRSTKNTPMLSNDDLKPFNDVMLLRAKGRRNVQTRLVEPRAKSLCSDDAFLLVTPSKLFGWFGEYCNVIERAKINEIADYIVIKGDLGCKVSSYKTIEENSNPGSNQAFWEILGGHDEWDRSTSPGSDEQYEVDVESTVKTYKMTDAKLVPHAEAWGKLPKMSMLQAADTYVFDFGAEMYIWQGKEVSFSDRRLAVRLARVLWEQDYDFTEQGFCPFHGKELKGPRPKFGLFARVNENLETSLFQEKFEDWSNIYRETGEDEAKMRETSRGKAVEEIATKSDIAVEAKPCDVRQMIDNKATHLPIIIDGFDVSCYDDEELLDEDGRVLEIVTEQAEQYFISESGVEKVDESVLHRENCYVIKWKYLIKSTGRFATSKVTNSKSTPSNSGRSKVAYFSWIGSDSAAGEKGTSALIASNMETDDWPVVSFTESTMPPVFRRCFSGNLLIINGKRGGRRGGFNWKLLRIGGSTSEAATLSEVNCECKSLRSSSSFVLLHPRDATAFVWHGCRSPKNVKDAAEYAVSQLSARMPKSIPFRRGKTSIHITICEEGDEPDGFWDAIGLKRRNRYECLVDSSLPTLRTRGWHFDIVSGEFRAKELEPFDPNAFLPLHQNQLLDVENPCLILVECTQAVYLWQNCDLESMAASAKRKWDVVRRLAIETTMNFCKERGRDEATLVEAGSEPNTFTNGFPSWISKDTTVLGRQKTNKAKPVSEVLASLTRLVYSIEELTSKELPDGVDARHLETYLSNEDFEKLFEMSKPEYYKLPSWKQIKLRQQKKFF